MLRSVLGRAGQSLGLPSQLSVASDGDVGIGTQAPFGHLHVQTASTGATSVNAGADELVLENSGNSGLTILGGANSEGLLAFGDPASAVSGQVQYLHQYDQFKFYTAGSSRLNLDSSGNFYPQADGTQNLGDAASKWGTVYAATGTINTSDARVKTAVAPFDPKEIAAAKALAAEIGTFRFLDALAVKGDAARHHVGLTVQRAIEIMEAHDLDPFAYGFICYDEWAATEADGSIPAQEAGNLYSFRTDELLLFLARGFDARLTALEAAP